MFDVLCYAVAIVAVLWFVGEPREAAPAPIAPPPVVADDLPTLEELMAESEVLTARPLPTVAQSAAVAAPVAIARVEVKPVAIDYAAMTSAQLRKECSRRAIAWRNAHGKGRHLLKEEMVKALA